MTAKRPKVLLIHGWNYANYTSLGCRDAWSNRSKFVEVLRKHFEVAIFNLPGFCGQADPDRPWTLDDYVEYVGKIIERERPDCVVGYSFGGAIALCWKKKIRDCAIKVFLVSPAIVRRYEKKDLSLVGKILKMILPDRLISIIRDAYLIDVVKNPYYSKATKVMRETYRNIVSLDLSAELQNLSHPITLIYGENDTATPPDLIKEVLKTSKVKHNLEVIKSGGHDIANSHTDELVSLILKELGG